MEKEAFFTCFATECSTQQNTAAVAMLEVRRAPLIMIACLESCFQKGLLIEDALKRQKKTFKNMLEKN